MQRRVAPLLTIVVLAAVSLAATILAGNSPELGLDLQGGASVVLEPPAGVPDDTVDKAIDIIRNRVDALGVAEPEISRQGDAVVVELPGVKDQQRALDVVGQTAELRFRTVLEVLPPEGEEPTTTTTSTTAPPTGADPATTSTTAPAEDAVTTPPEEDQAEASVVLPGRPTDEQGDVRYRLGPVALTGDALAGARARFEGNQWVVNLEFTEDGIDAFNQVAQECNAAQPTCPTSQLAIVLDSVVQLAPSILQPQYQRDQIQVTGQYSEGEAKDVALILRFGALPVQLEPQTVQTVSASLGEDSLRAGLVAGAIGTALVLLYMVLYYRALGLVVLLGLVVWSSLQWSVISYLGVSRGLALSLAGTTGIIVSVGVTVDSYVVYFERLKDEIRSGRSLRSSVDRGFKRAFRTILAADISAFIGAALLYWLTVGPVRGFAFFLGLSTVLDVAVAWFFTRPLVALLARRRVFTTARFLGVTQGAGADAPAAGSLSPPVRVP